jgi:hypothetical protein
MWEFSTPQHTTQVIGLLDYRFSGNVTKGSFHPEGKAAHTEKLALGF